MHLERVITNKVEAVNSSFGQVLGAVTSPETSKHPKVQRHCSGEAQGGQLLRKGMGKPSVLPRSYRTHQEALSHPTLSPTSLGAALRG